LDPNRARLATPGAGRWRVVGRYDWHSPNSDASHHNEREVQRRQWPTPSPTKLPKKAKKARAVWISFVGRILAQILGAIASVALGLVLLQRYQAGSSPSAPSAPAGTAPSAASPARDPLAASRAPRRGGYRGAPG
jgi:hypothetical protein